jgi:hypothetical protein
MVERSLRPRSSFKRIRSNRRRPVPVLTSFPLDLGRVGRTRGTVEQGFNGMEEAGDDVIKFMVRFLDFLLLQQPSLVFSFMRKEPRGS